jgi:hypothetical protein
MHSRDLHFAQYFLNLYLINMVMSNFGFIMNVHSEFGFSFKLLGNKFILIENKIEKKREKGGGMYLKDLIVKSKVK